MEKISSSSEEWIQFFDKYPELRVGDDEYYHGTLNKTKAGDYILELNFNRDVYDSSGGYKDFKAYFCVPKDYNGDGALTLRMDGSGPEDLGNTITYKIDVTELKQPMLLSGCSGVSGDVENNTYLFDTLDKTGMKVEGFSGWSQGCFTAFRTSVDYVTEGKNSGPILVTLNDPQNLLSKSDNFPSLLPFDETQTKEITKYMQPIMDSNSTITVVLQNEDNYRSASVGEKSFLDRWDYQAIGATGVDFLIMSTKDTKVDHSGVSSNSLDYYLANGNYGFNKINIDEYDFYKFNDKTNQLELIKDVGEIKETLRAYYTNKVDGISLQLSENDKNLLNNGASDEQLLATNFISALNGINTIRSNLYDTNFLSNTQNVTLVNSTTLVPSQLMSCQKNYFGITSDLLGSMSRDTALIGQIIQTTYDMDQDLKNKSNGLSSGYNRNFKAEVSATIDSILSQNIGVETTFDTMYLTGSHILGDSGRINIQDINSMLSPSGQLIGPLFENLNLDSKDAVNTKNSIEQFQSLIGTNSELKGLPWDAVNNKLDQYNDLLDKRIAANATMQVAMQEALKLLRDYMEDYTELDDANIPAVKQSIADAIAAIEALQAKISEMVEVTISSVDIKGNATTYTYWTPKYSAAEISAFNEEIATCQAQIVEFTNELNKLEGLYIVESKAEGIVNRAMQQIYESYGTEVSSVTTGTDIQYEA